MYCPPEYRMKGEFHGKPATVWSLGILLFRILCGHFPDTFDFYRINMNTWYDPDLTEGNVYYSNCKSNAKLHRLYRRRPYR